MRILVTGHMGLIGRHVAREMKSAGHDVHGCDIRGGMDCRETFRINDLKYDLIFHCTSGETPARRLGTDADLIEWVDRVKPGKLVYFSSSEVYPEGAQQEPGRQVEGAQPDTVAGMALLAVEELVLERSGLVFRPFEVYGQGGRGGFEAIAALVRERLDPFSLPDCGMVHDYIHVEDAVAAVMAALDGGYQGGPVNLCTGEATARDELADLMFEEVGWHPKGFQCAYPDRSAFLCGDAALLESIRRPTISLVDGIRRELSTTSITHAERSKK